MNKPSLPWQQLMQFGLRDLRLPPEQFWQSTIKELLVMRGEEQAISQQELTELIKQFPDL